jgi:hypothetical protein
VPDTDFYMVTQVEVVDPCIRGIICVGLALTPALSHPQGCLQLKVARGGRGGEQQIDERNRWRGALISDTSSANTQLYTREGTAKGFKEAKGEQLLHDI